MGLPSLKKCTTFSLISWTKRNGIGESVALDLVTSANVTEDGLKLVAMTVY